MIENGPTLDALIAFAHALEDEGIDPMNVEVRLPRSDWRTLSAAVARDSQAMQAAGDPTADLIVVSAAGPLNILGVRYLIRDA